MFRHRIAPIIGAQIAGSQRTGQLRVKAVGITKVHAAQRGIVVDLEDGTNLSGDPVINATGPSTRFTATRSVLLRNLLRRAVVAPDATDMGVRVDPDHTVVDRDEVELQIEYMI